MSSNPSLHRLSSPALYLTVFAPFALGHYVSFLFRSINAVLSPYLVDSMSLNAAQLGLLSSAYFVAFGLAQLPIGIALDRYGPKRMQPILLCVAASGALLFALGQSFTSLFLARVLIGLGLSACFMGAIKALAGWVASERRPTMNGYLLAVGGIGAMSATLPVEMALGAMSWRELFLVLAGLTIVPALLIWLIAPHDRIQNGLSAWQSVKSLPEVYRNKAFQRAVALLLPSHAVAFGLQGLWMGQWMQDAGGLSPRTAAVYLFWGMGAIVAGSLLVGHLTEWLGRRYRMRPMDVAGVGIGLFLMVQVLAALSIVPLIPAITIAFTFVGAVAGLDYTIVSQSVPSSMTGRAATSLNVLIFMGAFAVQSGFGLIVEFWGADSLNRYPVIAYQIAFGAIASLQLPGFLHWMVVTRLQKGETA
ncbi:MULTISPECIES: MFS transporter [unclassified Acidovorax]|uniref:MFS transporter n=1 Tax=unclassified Acidovorax TaxID=2684926 RepID=UPI001C48E936|nr:MFS transporter [Acidovorax sp. sif0632]MBV7464617.1 MFS transporter [Acidovorax sp. sif0613]